MTSSPTPIDVQPRSGVSTLLRAALPAVPGLNQLPGVRKTGGEFTGLAMRRPPVRVEREHVDAYARVCGFPLKDTLPLPYPHMLAFGMHMALMSSPEFPVPAMGMVHIDNTITAHRRIGIGEELAVTCAVDAGRPHPVGTAYAFSTSVADADGATVWESVSTYLRRGRRNPDLPRAEEPEEVPPSGPVFALKGDLGRRYAAVSGDYNPIHLTPLSAKALGFRRHIAHGMWTKARCIAALENRLPDQVRVEVAFKKPVFLPSSVAYGARPVPGGYGFSLHRRGADTLHLVGRTTAL